MPVYDVTASAVQEFCDSTTDSCLASATYDGVFTDGDANARWELEGGVNAVSPVSEENLQADYNPLFGPTVGKFACGDVIMTADSLNSNKFDLDGSFNVCTGLIPNLTLPVHDFKANGNSTETTPVVSEMTRPNNFVNPPLMSNLKDGQDGCSVMDALNSADAWGVAEAEIHVTRDVTCFVCKATMPNLRLFDLDSQDSHVPGMYGDSQLDQVVQSFCIEIPCTDSELDSTMGNVCFRTDRGYFDCRENDMIPNEVISKRIYGNDNVPTTACGPMQTIGRAIAGEWQQEVRGSI